MVKVLSRPRRAGKTYEAILESQRTGAVIICANSDEAKRVELEAKRMGIDIPQPISSHNAYIKLSGHRSCGCIVDNCDWILEQFLGIPVSAVTFNGPSAEIIWPEASQSHSSSITPSETNVQNTELKTK